MKIAIIVTQESFKQYTGFQAWAMKMILERYAAEVTILFYQVSDFSFLSHKRINGRQVKNLEELQIETKGMDYCFLLGDTSIKDSEEIKNLLQLPELMPAEIKWFCYHLSGDLEEWCQEHSVPQLVRSFEAISVRGTIEQSSILTQIRKADISIYLPPVLLLKKKEYKRWLKKERVFLDPFIFVDFKMITQEITDRINLFAEQTKTKVVHFGSNGTFKEEIVCDRSTFLDTYLIYLNQAAYILTDQYETTAFAVLFRKDFLTFGGEQKNSTTELLDTLQLSSHIVKKGEIDDITEANAVFSTKEEFEELIQNLRYRTFGMISRKFGVSKFNMPVLCPTNITKKECYGCLACKEICPTDAITMVADKEGFLYPVVNEEKCIHCGACERACIRKHSQLVKDADKASVYCALNQIEEVRMKSSSGGVFPELVKYTIEQEQGAVVGVRFDSDMHVISDIANTIEEAKAFYGSKYVKSSFDGMFPKIKSLLEEGRMVLYSGLPCECAGLRSYLRKDYEKLFICEILCHASPSPKILERYVLYLQKKFGSKVVNITFRDKSNGWRIYECSFAVEFENGEKIMVNAKKNNYFNAFLNDYISRPCCEICQFTYTNRVGDITIGDFWGIQNLFPAIYDDKGASLILVNTDKGKKLWENVSDRFTWEESAWVPAFKSNHSSPSLARQERYDLFADLGKIPINKLLGRYNLSKTKKIKEEDGDTEAV